MAHRPLVQKDSFETQRTLRGLVFLRIRRRGFSRRPLAFGEEETPRFCFCRDEASDPIAVSRLGQKKLLLCGLCASAVKTEVKDFSTLESGV